MEEITAKNKDDKPEVFMLPYSETKHKGDMSMARERIELG